MNDLRMEPEKDGSELDKRIAGSLNRSKDGGFIMSSKFPLNTCKNGIIREKDTPESVSDKLTPFALAGNIKALYM
jgi:hypothetical protein